MCSVFAKPQHLLCKDLEQLYVLTAKTSLRQVEATRQCTRFMQQNSQIYYISTTDNIQYHISTYEDMKKYFETLFSELSFINYFLLKNKTISTPNGKWKLDESELSVENTFKISIKQLIDRFYLHIKSHIKTLNGTKYEFKDPRFILDNFL